MAIEKIVNVSVNTTKAVKSLEELGGSFEDVYGEALPLSGKIGELEDRLYEMALAGDQSTKEFKDLSREIGSMKKVIIDTDMAVDGMSMTMAQNVGGALGGLTSGFAIAQGAMASFGVEGEQIEATLLKVQSAMAISQGFQGLREAVPSFRALSGSVKEFGAKAIDSFKGATTASKAFMLTGIGLVITAIGTAITYWDDLSDAVSGNTEAQKTANAVMTTAIDSISEEYGASKQLSKVLEDETISREDKVTAVKQLQEQYPNLLGNIDAENTSIKDINKALKLNTELLKLNAQVKAVQELRSEQYKVQLQAEADAQTGANEGLINSIQAWTIGTNAKDLGIAKSKQVYNESKKEEKAFDDLEKKLNKQVKALEDLGATNEAHVPKVKATTQAVKDNSKAVEEARRKQEEYNQALKAEQDALAEKNQWLDEIAQAEEDALTSSIDKEINAVSDKYFQLIEKAREYGQEVQILEDEQQLQIQAIKDKYAAEEQAKADEAKDAKDAKDKDDRDKEVAANQALQDAKFEAASAVLSALNDLVGAFAGKSEAQQKKAFQIQKAISIAQAVMDTYKGATAIFASAAANPATVLFPAQAFIMAGAAIAAGLANVATISKQTFQGGGASGGGGGGVSAPSIPTASASPNFNVVGNSGVNQLAQSLGQAPLKAYVVSGEVTTAQSLDRNKIEQSTL